MLDQKQMYCFKYWNNIYIMKYTHCFKYLLFYFIDLMARRSTPNIIVSYIIFMYAALNACCVTTITCNKLPWRWPVFCVSISYVTSQPKGQKLMEDEIACDFLPPTTVTMLHTHAVALLREVWEPLPSLNKLPWYARLSRKIWHCFLMLKLRHSHGEKSHIFCYFSDCGSSQACVGDS